MIGLIEQQQSSYGFSGSSSPSPSHNISSNNSAGGSGSGSSSHRGLQRDLFCSPRLIIGFFIFCVAILFGFGATSALYSKAGLIGGTASAGDSTDSSSMFGGFWHSRSSDPRHDSSHRVLPHPEQRLADVLENKLQNQHHDGATSSHDTVAATVRNDDDYDDGEDRNETDKHNSSFSGGGANNNNNSKTLYTDWYLVQGKIRMRMRPDAAPKTVANILRLIRNGAYNKTGCFYRCDCDVARPFVLQGGLCSRSDHKTVPLEYKLPNKKWTVSMARTSNRNSGGSEWFINLAGNSVGLGPKHKGGYAVFAEVVSGFDVIKKLMQLPTHSSAGISKKTGKRKKGGMMLFSKPVPHFLGVSILEE